MAPASNIKPLPRLQSIQGLRGLAVLLVILVHLHHTELKYHHGITLSGPWISFGISGVDIFLVVSGFVLTYLAFGHFEDRRYLQSYAYARVTRVYPVYMLLTLLLIPIYLAVPALFNASEGNQVNLWRSLFLVPDVHLPLIPVAWTLHHELYFYIVFAFMLLLPERQLLKAMTVWLVVILGSVAVGLQTPRDAQGAFERVLVNPINLEFILGMGAAWALVHGPRVGVRSCLVLACAILVTGYAAWVSLTGSWWVSDFWRVWVFGVPATLLVYALVRLERDHGVVRLARLAWIGDGAYSIYLTHLMVIVVIGRVWKEIGIEGLLAHVFFLSASLAIALGFGYLFYLRVEKPMLAFARRHDPTRAKQVAADVAA